MLVRRHKFLKKSPHILLDFFPGFSDQAIREWRSLRFLRLLVQVDVETSDSYLRQCLANLRVVKDIALVLQR